MIISKIKQNSSCLVLLAFWALISSSTFVQAEDQTGPTPEPPAPQQPAPEPTPEPGPVTFKQLSEQIFTPLCIKCHGTGMKLAGVRLDNYADAVKSAEALKKSTLKGSMPPSGPRLTKEQGDLILNWLDNGMLE